ncbi:MAG: arylamine N-acetyltransferase [Bacteroidetes bacterium]|nr:arylamine N-acetyltransferase [Bacteroidota bacterium]
MFKRDLYLRRIGFSGPLEPTAKTLARLQEMHLLSVPFENLDIHSRQSINLAPDALFQKIVEKKRGGFCYELNGLFFDLLKAAGFDVQRISARVFNRQKGEFGPEFDHLALWVRMTDTDYLADVGFGDFSRHPLRIKPDLIQADPAGQFRLLLQEDNQFLVQKSQTGSWENQYLFSLKSHSIEAFSEMCRFHQTSPESHFTRQKLVSLATRNGRITLTDRIFRETENGAVKTEIAVKETEFGDYLEKYFPVQENQL